MASRTLDLPAPIGPQMPMSRRPSKRNTVREAYDRNPSRVSSTGLMQDLVVDLAERVEERGRRFDMLGLAVVTAEELLERAPLARRTFGRACSGAVLAH